MRLNLDACPATKIFTFSGYFLPSQPESFLKWHGLGIVYGEAVTRIVLGYQLIIGSKLEKNSKIYVAGHRGMVGSAIIANEALLAWESKLVPLSGLDNYKTAIVLTGITSSTDHISDRVFFGKGADRLLHTIQLYKAGKIRNISMVK